MAPAQRELAGRRVLCDTWYRGHVIYGLVDPLEPTRIRYVGISSNPAARYTQHVQMGTAAAFKVREWVAAMQDRLPVMVLIEHCGPQRLPAETREDHWIQEHKQRGEADLNAW